MATLPDDTSVLLYALLSADAVDGTEQEDRTLRGVLNRRGAFDQPLTLLRGDVLTVLASPLPDPGMLRRPATDAVLAYKSVIDAAHEQRTVVPLRFGTRADTPADARALLRSRAEAGQRQLDHLDGHVEMGVRLTLREGAGKPEEGASADLSAPSGTAYLRARKAHYERTDGPLRTAVRTYHDALLDHAADATRSTEPDAEPPTASLAFLVERDAVDRFRHRVAAVTVENVQAADVVGPWAPFSFATLPLTND